MSAPVIASGGGSTVNRKWVFEVNTGTSLVPNWVGCGYVSSFTPLVDTPSLQDSTTFGDAGYSSQDKTGAAWSLAATVMRKIPDIAPTTYDVGQEYIRNKAIGNFGAANRIQVRWYEYDPNDPTGVLSPRIEAYMGSGAVSWAESGGAQDAEDMVQISVAGQGKLSKITHPYPAAAAVPLLELVSPTTLAAAGGTAFRLTGVGFTGTVATTGVKFGGTNATSWTVWSDTEITGVAPAHAAGSGIAVVVTNATGPSTTGPTVTFV